MKRRQELVLAALAIFVAAALLAWDSTTPSDDVARVMLFLASAALGGLAAALIRVRMGTQQFSRGPVFIWIIIGLVSVAGPRLLGDTAVEPALLGAGSAYLLVIAVSSPRDVEHERQR